MASRGNGGRWQLEVDTTSSFNGNNVDNAAMPTVAAVAAASPTSSQGSWVVDPDDGWDGLGAVPVPRSPEAAQQGRRQQLQQQQRRVSPASSSLRRWAQVPASPPAAEYPATMASFHSPPQSPGSVRSASSAGSSGSARAAAGDGLVALARDQNQSLNLNLNPMDISDGERDRSSSSSSSSSPSPASAAGGILPRSLTFETFEALETPGFDQGTGSGGRGGGVAAGVGIGCTTVGDVNAMEMQMDMDMDVADFGDEVKPMGEHEHAFVVRAAPGMTAAEAVEAIAEAAELRGITPTSVVLAHPQVSPSRTSTPSGGASPSPSPSLSLSLAQEGKENGHVHTQETMFRPGHSPVASYRSLTPPHNPSPSSTADVTGVPDVDAARVGSSRVSPGSMGAPTRIPMDSTVGIDVDVDVGVNGKYDGKHMDRLWRWTGLITAAKIGVIPIIVYATVAALSTQTGGGGRDRGGGGEGSGGGGGGGGSGAGGGRGGGGGGGGGTRCFSRRRPRGGGGCFPDARIDRCGIPMPMPYCVAPSVACA